MEILQSVVTWILVNFKWGIFFMCSYLLFVALGNILPRPKAKPYPPKTRFAIVIPAHNEERVIGDLIRNLKAMDYPQEMVDIYVVCDRCTDRTPQIVKEEGAVALIKTGGEQRGKGAALDWGIQQVLALKGKGYYHAYCFFDADNQVRTNFLQVMNDHLNSGHHVLQAFLDLKNPRSNWITRTIFVEQRSTNFLWHGGKTRWGLGNYLIGTGMCVKGNLIEEEGWKVKSLTEDLEFSLKVAMKGERIYWVEDTRVFDEAPMDLKTIWFQRQRWAIGAWRCFFRYFFPCLFQAFRRGSLRLLDMALYLTIQAYGVFTIIFGIANFLNLVFRLVYLPADPVTAFLGTFFVLTYVPSGIIFSRIPLRENIPYILVYMGLLTSLGAIEAFFGLFRVGTRVWFHTPHRAKLDEKIKL
ncbi:MAG: glycosyltransferase [Caldiserica bacterium]|jgi:cellulose synthase/poly-beta-1,6-N-acetylglucosamine synthase-like glycosyltransferase|nr:glycosyltransferase [Caldisericota bacterium]MDH7562094.1 glycosyltransferase family 2 protein [Caldisericota bacterium]